MSLPAKTPDQELYMLISAMHRLINEGAVPTEIKMSIAKYDRLRRAKTANTWFNAKHETLLGATIVVTP